MGAYFLMSPDFRTSEWPCRQQPELRLVPTIRDASELPIPCFITDHSEPARRSLEGRPGTFLVFSAHPIATPKSSGVATTRGRQAITMVQFSTVTDKSQPQLKERPGTTLPGCAVTPPAVHRRPTKMVHQAESPLPVGVSF
jgi:hypothetical protein